MPSSEILEQSYQLTGVGSRYVGYFISVIFIILGLFPIVVGVFQALPQPVLE